MRKMKVDQEKAQNEIEARKREEALVEKLMEHSMKVGYKSFDNCITVV